MSPTPPYLSGQIGFVSTPWYSKITNDYLAYLHSEMLKSHVLTIDIQCVVFGRHVEHLLEVCLNSIALLMVDGVSVARHWGALILTSNIWLRGVEPGVGNVGAFRRWWRMLLSMRRSSVRWGMVDTLTNAAPGTNRLSKRLSHWRSVVVVGSTSHVIHIGAPLQV